MSRIAYSMLDWAIDLIRSHERNHGRKPDSLLLTDAQIWGLAEAIAWTSREGRSLIDTVDSIRRGEGYLMGVPVRLFEVAHGPAQ